MTVAAGGVVSNSFGYIGYIGYRPGSTGVVTVTGPGSQWNNSFPLYVGETGTGTLNVENGGRVEVLPGDSRIAASIGKDPGSYGTVSVTGTDSIWNNSGSLYVGDLGSDTLNVEAGGVVANTDGYLARESGGRGVVTVSGTDSTWTNSGDLHGYARLFLNASEISSIAFILLRTSSMLR